MSANKIILFLAVVLVSLVSIAPLLLVGKNAAFFNIDPDVVYIANALTDISSGKIYYYDHPGTPTVSIMAYSYIPLQIYSGVIRQTNFMSWSFDHLRFLMIYSRLIQFFIFLGTLFIFTLAVAHNEPRTLTPLFAILALVPFPYFLRMGLVIMPETISFLFIALWVLFFTVFEKGRSPFMLIVMSLLSGLAVANKYNNFFLVLGSLILVFWIQKLTKVQRVSNLVFALLVAVMGFFIGIWPIKQDLPKLFDAVVYAFLRNGAHGAGYISVFDLSYYVKNIVNFWNTNLQASIIVIFGIVLITYSILKRKLKINSPIIPVFIITLFINMFYLKYDLQYYLLPGYILIIFLFSRILNKYSIFLTGIIILFLLSQSLMGADNYLKVTTQDMQRSVELEKYVLTVSPKRVVIWDYGNSQDFSYIWMRAWGKGLFDSDLILKRPDLLELNSNDETVNVSYNRIAGVFNICWNRLFIRQERVGEFLNLYKSKGLSYKTIDDTGIWEIENNQCSKSI